MRRQQSKKGGRKKRRGWREVEEKNPHPSLLLQAITGKYLYFLNIKVSAKGVQIRETPEISTTEAA